MRLKQRSRLPPHAIIENRLREQLGAPLRHDLVLAGLLLDWRTLHDDAAAPGRTPGRQAR